MYVGCFLDGMRVSCPGFFLLLERRILNQNRLRRNTTQINDRMVRTAEMITINEMTDRRVTRIGEPSPVGADSRSWPATATRVTYGSVWFCGKDREKRSRNEKRIKANVSNLEANYNK